MYTKTNINQEELDRIRQHVNSFPPPLTGGGRIGGLTIGENVIPLTVGERPILTRVNDLESRLNITQLEYPEEFKRIYERLERLEKLLGI